MPPLETGFQSQPVWHYTAPPWCQCSSTPTSALKPKIWALKRLCPEQQRKIKPAKEMEDCQIFWQLWWWTFKTALRKPHSSKIIRTSLQLNARFSPTEPKHWASQRAKTATKCYFIHQQDNHVVPRSIRAHLYNSCYLLSLGKFYTWTCRNIHADIPLRRGSPHHGGDKLSFPVWNAVPQTPRAPYLHGDSCIASSQKLEELWTQNAQPGPAYTNFQQCHCPCSARSILRSQVPIHNSFTNSSQSKL